MSLPRIGLPWPVTAEQAARWSVGLVVLGALVLGWLEGGYAASRWAPCAAAALWLAVAAWATMRWPRPSRSVAVTLAAFGLLALWTLLSVLWADTPGRALEAAGRTVLYGGVLALAILPRWPRASLRRLLVLVGFGSALLAGLTLVRVVLADDPSRWFIDGRLVAPTGYVNATAGLWTMTLFPLLHLAAGALRHPAARVLALGAAGLVAQVSLLSQSRGALLATGVAIVVLLALTPERGATALALLAVLVATVLVSGVLLDVRGAPTIEVLTDRLGRAGGHIALATLGLLVVGAAWQAVVWWLPDRPYDLLTRPRVGDVAVGASAVALLIAFVVAVGNPVSWTGDKVDQALNGGYTGVAQTGDRLTGSLGSNRGDMYRVALKAFSAHPVLGVGAEDFQVAYLQDRRSAEAPRFAHSLELGILSGIGLVGALLALVAYGAPVVTALRRFRRLERSTRAGVAAALTGFAAWLAEASWDWTWEFPTLTVLALVLLGAAMRATDADGAIPSPELLEIRARARAHGVVVPGDEPVRPALPASRSGRAVLGAGLVVALAATIVLAGIASSSYYLRRGTALAASDPRAALVDLAHAARLNPLDSDALLSRAVVARRLGDVDTWRSDLERAVDRSPDDWFAHLELGLADAAAGRRAAAAANVARAGALNPQQPVIGEVATALRRGQGISPAVVEARISGALTERLQPVGP